MSSKVFLAHAKVVCGMQFKMGRIVNIFTVNKYGGGGEKEGGRLNY